MDVLTAMELADKLGGISPLPNYDEILVTIDHLNRVRATIQSGNAVEFGGIKVVANNSIPNGYGVLRSAGKVVGVIDFVNHTSLLLKDLEK